MNGSLPMGLLPKPTFYVVFERLIHCSQGYNSLEMPGNLVTTHLHRL